MFYGNVLISHGFGFVFATYQYLVQVLSDILLSAGYFDSGVQGILHIIQKMLFVNLHLFDHL